MLQYLPSYLLTGVVDSNDNASTRKPVCCLYLNYYNHSITFSEENVVNHFESK